jgi:4-amino-4-deoxy-L-arabinose transferase-like glycosyltransferase
MSRWIAAILGVLCLGALAEINGERYDIPWLMVGTNHAQFALLVGGSILLVWGLGGGRSSSRVTNIPLNSSVGAGLRPAPTKRSFQVYFALIPILLLATALRTWNLENAVHFYVDETNFVEGILRLWKEPGINLLGPFNYIAAFTWIYPYMQAGSVAIFGANLVGMRAVSAAFGVLTVAATYLVARTLFDRKTALLAAFLLAVFPPHIHFSRLGLNNIADPLFGTLALAFLTRGFKTGRSINFALGGVMVGLTQYFYEGGRLLFPALGLAWAVIGALAWRPQADSQNWHRRGESATRPYRKSSLKGLLITALAAILIGAPVYYTLSSWDIPFTMRLRNQGLNINYWTDLLLSSADEGRLALYWRSQLSPPLQHFITLPDDSHFYYGGDTALILPFMLPFFGLGLVMAFRLPAAGSLLALWLLFTALGNSLISDNAWSARFVVSFPALAILMAVGMKSVLDALTRIVLWRRLERYALPLFLSVLGIAQIIYYFGPHLALYNLQIRSEAHDQQDIIFRARDFRPGTKIYLVTDDPDIFAPVPIFLSQFWGLDVELVFAMPESFAAGAIIWGGTDYAFFVEKDDTATLTLLRERFGLENGIFSPYNVPPEKQYMLLYYQSPMPYLQ